ncbi:MAG: DUF3667 domain-containing protein, partial [Saprospiraceae bacterium]|nr:DUF3667 domain-containing protein [Saprospiraceae bacterium]
MENEQPIRHCRNCDAPLPEQAVYCTQCSQKDHDGRYSFSEMMAELFTTVLNIDSIAIRTARALAIPGKLTQDYFDGKHIRYYRPIKLFFYTG